MASQALALKLKNILAEDYGKDVSLEDAEQILGDLTAYFDLLAQVHHKSVLKGSGVRMGSQHRTE